MEIAKKLWEDIRPNLVWLVLSSIFGGGVMAALFSWLRALSNNPVTVGGAAIIFVISLAVIAVGIAIYLVSERRTNKHSDREGIDNKESVHHKWSIPVLGIVVILLGAWNLSLQRRVRNLEVETVRYVMPRQLTKEQIIA